MKRKQDRGEGAKGACECLGTAFPDHAVELSRLNRAIGQLEGVKRMIQERRYCVEILHQVRAARQAIKGVEVNVFQRHLDACVTASFDDVQERHQKIEEIKELLARF